MKVGQPIGPSYYISLVVCPLSFQPLLYRADTTRAWSIYMASFSLCCAFPQLALFGTCAILMCGVLSVPSTTCGTAYLMYRWRGDAADREVQMRRRCILESVKERRASRELALQQAADGGTAASA